LKAPPPLRNFVATAIAFGVIIYTLNTLERRFKGAFPKLIRVPNIDELNLSVKASASFDRRSLR
jgi:hypothetical protein